MNYFEVKLRYDRNHPTTGKEVTVTEPYLVDANSYTEAELRITKQAEQMVSGEFMIKSIARSGIIEAHMGDANMNFLFTIGFVDTTADGKEKITRDLILINAENVQAAKDRVEQLFEKVLIPWRIVAMKESKIIEVFEYIEEGAE